MGRKAKEQVELEVTDKEKYKVRFLKTYIGNEGIFYKNNVYELKPEQFKIFVREVEEVIEKVIEE
jgi:hypothetical protein